MKAKTIKSVINNKVTEWINTIEDDGLKKLLEKNVIVTGGCIASMLLREKVNDFDIYFRTKETVVEVVKYYLKKFTGKNAIQLELGYGLDANDIGYKIEGDRVKIVVKSSGMASETQTDNYEYFETIENQDEQDIATQNYIEKAVDSPSDDSKPPYRPVFITSNAITLSNKVQLIIRFYGEPEEIHSNYDFIHCTNYWCSWNKHLVLSKEALESLLTKELRYTGSKYPLCSIIRTRKFIKREWTINAGQYLKMCVQLNELDLTDISVLEEQLIGVDIHYFYDILEKLKEKDSMKVDSAYLMEIIDRVF